MSQIGSSIPGVFSVGSIATSDSGRFAQPTITSPSQDPQTGTGSAIPVTANMVETSGIAVGRQRSTDEDIGNLVARQAIQNELSAIQRQETAVSAQNDPLPVISSKQAVTQAQNREQLSAIRTKDTTRALEKIQRACNHKYDRYSRRCLFCSKHRDSHVYDVGSKSIS